MFKLTRRKNLNVVRFDFLGFIDLGLVHESSKFEARVRDSSFRVCQQY